MSTPRSNTPIALFNGTGTPKNEAAAVTLLGKAARQNSPIAQNRLARLLLSGQGTPMDKVESLEMASYRENPPARATPVLDEALSSLSPEDRARGGSRRA